MRNFSNLLPILSDASIDIEDLEKLKTNLPKEYHSKDISKDTTGTRRIYIPSEKLKVLLRLINNAIDKLVSFPTGVTSTTGQGLVGHLKPHQRKEVVITADIKDFYPSVKPVNIVNSANLYSSIPQILLEEVFQFSLVEGIVPQGFPTSSLFANLSILDVWSKVQDEIKDMEVDVTVYSDDWAISGERKDSFFVLDRIRGLLMEKGFSLSPKKQKVMWRNMDQIICKVRVNNKLEIKDDYLQSVVDKINQYGDSPKQVIQEDSHIMGKIYYVSSINISQGKKLKSLVGLK